MAQRLTARERQVLLLAAGGRINKQIAKELSVTPQTIKNHMSNIMEKLDAQSRTAAVMIALRNGTIKSSEIKLWNIPVARDY